MKQKRPVLPTLNLKISETFFSIQGEGPFAGYPTFFIRLFGCNLKCTWCDTLYARESDKYQSITLEEIIKLWENHYSSIPYIAITGGEPLLQPEVYPLIDRFLNKKCIVCIETNGSLSIKRLHPQVIKVMDLKTPSSGMADHNLYENIDFLSPKDVIKFVIQDRKDFEFALDKIKTFDLISKTQVYFSPVFGKLSPKDLANWLLEIKLPIRLQLQLHKILNLK